MRHRRSGSRPTSGARRPRSRRSSRSKALAYRRASAADAYSFSPPAEPQRSQLQAIVAPSAVNRKRCPANRQRRGVTSVTVLCFPPTSRVKRDQPRKSEAGGAASQVPPAGARTSIAVKARRESSGSVNRRCCVGECELTSDNLTALGRECVFELAQSRHKKWVTIYVRVGSPAPQTASGARGLRFDGSADAG